MRKIILALIALSTATVAANSATAGDTASNYPVGALLEGKKAPPSFFGCSGLDHVLYVSVYPSDGYAEFMTKTKDGDKQSFRRKMSSYSGFVAMIQGEDGMYTRYMRANFAKGDGFFLGERIAQRGMRIQFTNYHSLQLWNDPNNNNQLGMYDNCLPTDDN